MRTYLTGEAWHNAHPTIRTFLDAGSATRFRPGDGLGNQRARTHGQATRAVPTATGSYKSWLAMKGRCLTKTNGMYPKYGGAGITVCERWLTFENFYADMGERPEGMSIDRIDNDRGYEPGNVRWATALEQRHNRG